MENKSENILKIGSVFSGIGAFEHALIKSNIRHQILFACDIDIHCKTNYLANYKVEDWYDNITDLEKKLKEGKKYMIDIIVGGSPCQSWSIAGKRKGLDDMRGNLINNFINVIRQILPKYFIFENVKGFMNYNNGEVFNNFKNEIEKLGYKTEYQVISPKQVGFPQSRERVFIVGRKDEIKTFPVLEKILNDKIMNYLDIGVEEKYWIKNHKWQEWICRQNLLDKQKMNINGEVAICQTARQYSSWYGNFILEYRENVNFSYCKNMIDCIINNKIKPFNISKEEKKEIEIKLDPEYITQNTIIRRLTTNECLALMGFDTKNFKNVCSDAQTYKQCGNSIVVNVLEEIIKKIV
jgi:DNA (cytosine-5)-methyltransferase 1